MFDMYNVTENDYWYEKLQLAKQFDGPSKEIDCVNECLHVKKDECDFMVYDKVDYICHIGNLSETSGDKPAFADESITLLAVKSNHS